MAEINAAYDLVRAAAQHGAPGAPRARAATRRAGGAQGRLADPGAAAARSAPSCWTRSTRGEDVRLVTPTSTWASPRAILAVTDRRLLWLLDDAPVARVHSLRFRNVAADRAQGRAASTPR